MAIQNNPHYKKHYYHQTKLLQLANLEPNTFPEMKEVLKEVNSHEKNKIKVNEESYQDSVTSVLNPEMCGREKCN